LICIQLSLIASPQSLLIALRESRDSVRTASKHKPARWQTFNLQDKVPGLDTQYVPCLASCLLSSGLDNRTPFFRCRYVAGHVNGLHPADALYSPARSRYEHPEQAVCCPA
jgi:hypothetical protein